MNDFEKGDGDDSVVYLRTTPAPAPARNVDEVQVKLRCKLKLRTKREVLIIAPTCVTCC